MWTGAPRGWCEYNIVAFVVVVFEGASRSPGGKRRVEIRRRFESVQGQHEGVEEEGRVSGAKLSRQKGVLSAPIALLTHSPNEDSVR